MNIRSLFMQAAMAIALALGVSAVPNSAQAATGLIILEGSDAQTFHGLEPYSSNFQQGLQIYSSAPLLPVLAIGSNPIGNASAGTVFFGSLAAAGPLSGYSGLYIGSPFTCCSENDAAVASAADKAAILAFHALGRSIAIENYQGGAAFSFLTGFTLTGLQAVGAGSPGGGSSCFDGNKITAAGGAFGLGLAGSFLPAIGCFGHQAYLSSFLAANGFAFNLADNQTLFPGYSVVASNGGGGISSAVPETSTWIMMLLGFAGLGFAGYRKQKVAAVAA